MDSGKVFNLRAVGKRGSSSHLLSGPISESADYSARLWLIVVDTVARVVGSKFMHGICKPERVLLLRGRRCQSAIFKVAHFCFLRKDERAHLHKVHTRKMCNCQGMSLIYVI